MTQRQRILVAAQPIYRRNIVERLSHEPNAEVTQSNTKRHVSIAPMSLGYAQT